MFCLLCVREWARAIDEEHLRQMQEMQSRWQAEMAALTAARGRDQDVATPSRAESLGRLPGGTIVKSTEPHPNPLAFVYVNTTKMRDLCDRLELCPHGARG